MRILALDLSTHTGYAILEGEQGTKPRLVEYGSVHLDAPVFSFGGYPHCYRHAGTHMAHLIQEAVCSGVFELVVIEEINLGRSRWTQKILENIHTAMLTALDKHKLPVVYLDSSEWRSTLQLRLNKTQKSQNAKLSRAKKKARDVGGKVNTKELGIRGRVTAKHLAIAKVNEDFQLSLKVKDNDIADAISIGYAWFLGATPCDGIV